MWHISHVHWYLLGVRYGTSYDARVLGVFRPECIASPGRCEGREDAAWPSCFFAPGTMRCAPYLASSSSCSFATRSNCSNALLIRYCRLPELVGSCPTISYSPAAAVGLCWTNRTS